jgi:hypothetical protein
MKNKLSLIIVGLLFTISCKKGTTFTNNASIIGIDSRMGQCTGGGYFIVVQGHPNPNNIGTGAFTTDTMPSSFQVPPNAHFPINVKLDWKVESKCDGNYIAISKIEEN